MKEREEEMKPDGGASRYYFGGGVSKSSSNNWYTRIAAPNGEIKYVGSYKTEKEALEAANSDGFMFNEYNEYDSKK